MLKKIGIIARDMLFIASMPLAHILLWNWLAPDFFGAEKFGYEELLEMMLLVYVLLYHGHLRIWRE